jgi:hypothetical protein
VIENYLLSSLGLVVLEDCRLSPDACHIQECQQSNPTIERAEVKRAVQELAEELHIAPSNAVVHPNAMMVHLSQNQLALKTHRLQDLQ